MIMRYYNALMLDDKGRCKMKYFSDNNGKIYRKSLFKTTEVFPQELKKICYNDDTFTSTLFFKDDRPEIEMDALWLTFDEIDYYIDNGVDYEDTTDGQKIYSEEEIRERIKKIKELIYPMCSIKIKEQYGEEYDIEITEMGKIYYKYLLLRLRNESGLIEEHDTYENMAENVPRAIDLIEISTLIKWDAFLGRMDIGLVHEELNKEYWEERVNEIFNICTLTDEQKKLLGIKV